MGYLSTKERSLMQEGAELITKYDGKIVNCIAEKIRFEDLDVKLENGVIISKKYWEVRPRTIK